MLLDLTASTRIEREAVMTMTKSRDPETTALLKTDKGQAEALSTLQKELMEAYEEAGRTWSERARTEVELWSELGKKLTETRSMPEAVQIYQQSLTRRMQMAAEDNQKLAADWQKLAQKFTRAMSPGLGGSS
jgi:hypothetical protein